MFSACEAKRRAVTRTLSGFPCRFKMVEVWTGVYLYDIFQLNEVYLYRYTWWVRVHLNRFMEESNKCGRGCWG